MSISPCLAGRRFRPGVELLEDRAVPSTVQWVNRGTATSDTDGYNAAFGANANAARLDTDAAIVAWQNVITSFNYADPGLNDTFKLTISADPTNTSNGAAASADAFDSSGKPTAGTIVMGVGGNGKGGGWFFDPNPSDLNAFFQGGLVADSSGFVAMATPVGPAAQYGDYFSVVAIEMAHAFGMGTAQSFTASPLFTKTTIADKVDAPGTLYTFNGPDVRALFTSDNGGTTDTGSPIHVALPGPTNTATDAQGKVYTGQVDTDNASYIDGRRFLPTQTDALVMKDVFGYTVNPNPTRFGPGNQALAGTGLAATGPGPGSGGNGLVLSVAATGQTVNTIQAYDPSFTGGFRTALGNDEGTDIAVTSPGPGGGPDVKVFDAHTGALRLSFFAFDPSFTGGVNVAVGDVNGDGVPDIIVAPMAGGGPVVRVFDGNTGQLIRQFVAYDPAFRGGVNVAYARVNLDADGGDESWIVTAPGVGGGPDVKVWGAQTGALLREFFAYDPSFRGGVNVAAGDTQGDGSVNIVTAPMAGGSPLVRVFDGAGDGTIVDQFFAYDSSFRGGVQVAVGVDASGDGTGDILTAPGPGGGPDVRVFDGGTGDLVDQYAAYDPSFRGGVSISDLGSS